MDIFAINFPLLFYAFLVIGISFIIKGIAGFGDPLLYNPLLSVFYNNANISPAMIPCGMVSNLIMVLKNRKVINFSLVLPIMIFNILGDIPGVLLLKLGAPVIVKLILGLVIIFLGIEMLTRKPGKGSKVNTPLLCIVSFFSGFTAGAFSINLFFVAYLERVLKDKDEFKSSICIVFLCETVSRTILCVLLGLISFDVITLAIVSIPACVIGLRLGGVIDKKLPDNMSRRFINYIFLIGGISTSIYALIGILG